MTVNLAPEALDGAQRAQLERMVARARILLEDDLSRQAEGRFGIHADGTIEDEQALPDDATTHAIRRDLVDIIAHLRTLGEDRSGAVKRLLREAAFTHLNRLLAIRIAEAIGLLPESLASGRQSRGFKDFAEIMPILGDDYWGYLQLCGDELAADVPSLFDPRNPLLELAPNASALDELVSLLSAPELTSLWLAPDALGWSYQFFNTGDERREMREQGAPRNSRELAVRNQFFTPRYVVDFLTQNTLGRRLMDIDPSSSLIADLPLLIDPPVSGVALGDLSQISVLDPACGSGHFLLGCYDILERAWELAGVPPSESAPLIVAALWGVDVDSRCVQVASAAIVLRARRHCRDLSLPRPNIATARGLPGDLADLPAELTPQQRELIHRISEIFADAPVLGPLLKAETAMEHEVRHVVFAGSADTLPLSDEAFSAVETDLLQHLQALADQASSSVLERLLAAEADDALRLLEILRRRYEVVLMNPPFGEPVPETKRYLRAAYPWAPTGVDLFSLFVGRGLELCNTSGYLGAITSRAGLFLTSFENWRRQVLLANRLITLADLGYKVMEQALVEAAAYVVAPGGRDDAHRASFIRLLKTADRPRGLADAVAADRRGEPDRRIYRLEVSELEVLPRSVLAYWMAPSIRILFTDLPKLEGSGATTRSGLKTADDYRFVRAFWEVDPRKIGRSAPETTQGKPWSPFAKGGEYSRYWADIHLVVDYGDEGERLRSYDRASLPSRAYYFRTGVTWPSRTASGFSPRVLPEGCIFGHKGPTAFALESESPVVLAWLTTRLANALLKALLAAADEMTSENTSKSFEVGHIQNLPWPGELLTADDRERMRDSALEIVTSRARLDTVDETSRRFARPAFGDLASVTAVAEDRERAFEEHALRAIQLAGSIDELVESRITPDTASSVYLDEEIGPIVDQLPLDGRIEDELIRRYWEMDLVAVIYELIDSLGGEKVIATKAFVADRRLELLASAFNLHPERLVERRRALRILPKNALREAAEALVSYTVGCAFGRWDVRVGRGSAAAAVQGGAFDLVPVCPPGMLVGADGFPARTPPEAYPLPLPPNGLLVDEPGHHWDIDAAVGRALTECADDPAEMTAQVLHTLGRKTLRDYLRRQFFRDHLARYSKSRRKAPLYWQLGVRSRVWGVWVYGPTLSRESLYAVAAEAARRQRLARDTIARLQREQQSGGAPGSTRRVAEELDAEETLAEELNAFREEAERIAGLGWQPNLDDGTLLCAAPLADLFPAWADPKKARDELRKGLHRWSSVAQWAELL